MGLIEPGHVYSYSQLSAVDQCPYMFYCEKIDRCEQVSNGFAEQGSLIHDLLDLWGKGMLSKDELVSEYQRRYPLEVVTAWPKMLASKGYATKAFNLGVEYFTNFDEFKGYEVIATEQRFKTDIAGRPFVGIIDMIVKSEETGEMIILDHKSKSKKAFKDAADEMYRQQYCYAKYFIEQYGKPPDALMFNLFKENGTKDYRKWDQQFYEDTMFWAEKQIEKIESYEFLDWLTSKDADFFCTEICSCRKVCPNGIAKPPKKGKK